MAEADFYHRFDAWKGEATLSYPDHVPVFVFSFILEVGTTSILSSTTLSLNEQHQDITSRVVPLLGVS